MNPGTRKYKVLSIITATCLLLALFVCMSGCKTGSSDDYSIKAAATTPKRDFDFSKGKIYVTNQITNSVSIANLDGSGGVNLGNIHTFVLSIGDIIVDNYMESIYISGPSIIKANLDGSEGFDTQAGCVFSVGSSACSTNTIAIDSLKGKLYIEAKKSKHIDNTRYPKHDDPTAIIQTNLDGSNKKLIAQGILNKIALQCRYIRLIAFNSKLGTMYLLGDNDVFMAKLDGSDFKKISESIGAIFAIDSENDKIYWVTWVENSITADEKEKKSDYKPKTLAEFKNILNDSDNNGTYYILRTNLEGKGMVNLGDLKGLMDSPKSIALDTVNKKMYIANWGNSTIIRANLDGTGAENIGNLNGTVKFPLCIAVLPPGAVGKSKESSSK